MKKLIPIIMSIFLFSCGGGGDTTEQETEPTNIFLGVAIQVFDPEVCEYNCPNSYMVLNYVSHDNIHSQGSGIAIDIGMGNEPIPDYVPCLRTSDSIVKVGDCVPSGFGIAIANPNDAENTEDAFRTYLDPTSKPKWVQHRLFANQFSGTAAPLHFEVGVDVGDDGISTIINTQDYVEFDSSVDGSYIVHLCLNIRTGQIHEAHEEPKKTVGNIVGEDQTPFLSCF